MKVMVIVKATPTSEAGEMPSEQLLREMGEYNEQLVKAGIILAGEGLHPSSRGARVRFSGKDRTVIQGPFAETKELIAGFWMWRVKSMDEAIEWLKRCPNPHQEECEVEIRPVFEAEDFGEAFTPELREQEASLRAQTLGLGTPRFENGNELVIAGLNASYTLETRGDIPAQWHRFAPRLGTIPGEIGKTAYGVCWNFREGCGFDYLTGVEVKDTKNLPSDMSQVRIPAGRYAVFTHSGHVSSLDKTLDSICTQWLPDSGLQPADAPVFERYSEEFDANTGKGGMEVWIPLKA